MSVPIESMSPYARSVVERLGLEAHPEGGWYTRDWASALGHDASGRPLASLIYFLLPSGDASAWHKVDADEIWLWHGPATVTLELGGDGDAPADESDRTTVTLGAGLAGRPAAHGDAAGAAPVGHALVPAGVWQRTVPAAGDALVSCVVSPGFTFEGFTLQ